MEEYTQEEVEEYTTEVKDICAKYKSYGMIFKQKSHLKKFVEWRTASHLSDPFYTFRTKLYWIVHDLTDFPKCKYCGSPLEHKNIDSVPRGYCDYCSNSCAQSADETKKKIENTCMERHGVQYPSASEQSKRKVRLTWKNKTKEEIEARTKKTKHTLKSRYGDENYANWELAKQTCLKLYGHEYYMQSSICYRKRRHKYSSEKYPGITFDSTWELNVYDFCQQNNIPCEYQPNIVFSYEYDGKLHTYHPDFNINGKLYEVKGDQFFRINKVTGKEEMFLPYRNKNWSDEQYEKICGKFEAKHQCMLKNGVTILRQMEMNILSEVIKNGGTK